MKNKQPLKNRDLFVLCAVLCASTLSIAACSKKEQPAAQAPVPAQATNKQVTPVATVQKKMSSVQSLIVAPPPGNQFDFSNKKDPFKPDIAVKAVPAGQVSDNKRINITGLPIHNFDVSQFRLIGIVTGSKENQAMVVDPNGKGYVLKPGMTIGKNEGRVTGINSGGVDVLEQFKDDNGRLRKENIRLTLPKKQ